MYLVRHMRGAAPELGLRNRTESTRKGFNLAGMKGTTYMEFKPVYLSRNLDLHLVWLVVFRGLGISSIKKGFLPILVTLILCNLLRLVCCVTLFQFYPKLLNKKSEDCPSVTKRPKLLGINIYAYTVMKKILPNLLFSHYKTEDRI